jgi:hypothetical protein
MKSTKQAVAAVRAAKNFDRWGADAATKYASKHGVSILQFAMALAIETRLALKRASNGR